MAYLPSLPFPGSYTFLHFTCMALGDPLDGPQGLEVVTALDSSCSVSLGTLFWMTPLNPPSVPTSVRLYLHLCLVQPFKMPVNGPPAEYTKVLAQRFASSKPCQSQSLPKASAAVPSRELKMSRHWGKEGRLWGVQGHPGSRTTIAGQCAKGSLALQRLPVAKTHPWDVGGPHWRCSSAR